ncbi:hypothetical protein MnTg02_02316 [bacterium MnTg02]|nr:hypothetical protein MnTg02_02316 [bacterium MnTg02]
MSSLLGPITSRLYLGGCGRLALPDLRVMAVADQRRGASLQPEPNPALVADVVAVATQNMDGPLDSIIRQAKLPRQLPHLLGLPRRGAHELQHALLYRFLVIACHDAQHRRSR